MGKLDLDFSIFIRIELEQNFKLTFQVNPSPDLPNEPKICQGLTRPDSWTSVHLPRLTVSSNHLALQPL